MNQDLLESLKKNIDILLKNNKINSAKLFLFGMNTPGDRVIQYLSHMGYDISGILDNNSNNHGKTMMGVMVYSPKILQQMDKNSVRVLICSKYYEEMKLQLEGMGLEENRHIFKLLELNSGTKVSDEKEVLENEIDRLKKYVSYYNRLVSKYDEETMFLLCPIRANGDVYMTACLMDQFKRENRLEKVVLVIVGSIGRKIAAMYGIRDIEVVSQKEMSSLTGLIRVLGSDVTRMIIAHPTQLYFNIFSNMECFKELNFMDLMAHGALGLKKKVFGVLEETDGQEYCLNSRDILLAPYANSLPCFRTEFWEKLAAALEQEGYHVYTNSSGNMEPPIKGTESIFLPIENMSKALQYSAGFIGIRNGLCDLVCKAECKKIILYPDKGMGFGDVKKFYSLNGMGLCKDAEELVYSEDMEEQVILLIIQRLKNYSANAALGKEGK